MRVVKNLYTIKAGGKHFEGYYQSSASAFLDVISKFTLEEFKKLRVFVRRKKR